MTDERLCHLGTGELGLGQAGGQPRLPDKSAHGGGMRALARDRRTTTLTHVAIPFAKRVESIPCAFFGIPEYPVAGDKSTGTNGGMRWS